MEQQLTASDAAAGRVAGLVGVCRTGGPPRKIKRQALDPLSPIVRKCGPPNESRTGMVVVKRGHSL